MKNGADGYVLKNANTSEIIEAIEEVNNGGTYLCDAAKELLKEESHNQLLLTNREKEALKLIADGFTNLQKAKLKHISYLPLCSLHCALYIYCRSAKLGYNFY